MNFFKERKCDQCGRPFMPQSATNTTCVPCMIKPCRENQQPKGEPMAQTCKVKICVDCKKEYTPTSNVQKRCPSCMKTHRFPSQRTTSPTVRRPEKTSAAGTGSPGSIVHLAETLLSVSGDMTAEIIIGNIRVRFDRV